jgi:5-methylcytosine-specific restriction endonuclease McrA
MKNEFLFQKIKELVATERRIGVEILELLYEIEKRKAYAELRYDGLYSYCVKELGFTDSQAYQRIQAMRALKEIPELKPAIESGTLSVSSVSKVQTHIRQENKKGQRSTKDEKLALFQAMKNHTSREVDAKLAVVRGEEPKKRIVLELDSELEALWKQVQDLAAHRSRGEDSEVLRILATEWLSRNHPLRKDVARTTRKSNEKSKEKSPDRASAEERVSARATPSNTPPEKSEVETTADEGRGARHAVPWSTRVTPHHPHEKWDRTSRVIPAELKRVVWRNYDGKCALCASGHALEIDHIHPFAKGGLTTEENLRLLCRSCNRFAAIRSYGEEKIGKPAQVRC